jgi:hypothetical protein
MPATVAPRTIAIATICRAEKRSPTMSAPSTVATTGVSKPRKATTAPSRVMPRTQTK